jgi:uncharacterized membrane protein (UPF0182 family)
MERNLETALNAIFGSGATASTAQAEAARPGSLATPQVAASTDREGLIREANQHFERAQQLLRQGDFAGYGEENRKLGEVLKRLAAEK